MVSSSLKWLIVFGLIGLGRAHFGRGHQHASHDHEHKRPVAKKGGSFGDGIVYDKE